MSNADNSPTQLPALLENVSLQLRLGDWIFANIFGWAIAWGFYLSDANAAAGWMFVVYLLIGIAQIIVLRKSIKRSAFLVLMAGSWLIGIVLGPLCYICLLAISDRPASQAVGNLLGIPTAITISAIQWLCWRGTTRRAYLWFIVSTVAIFIAGQVLYFVASWSVDLMHMSRSAGTALAGGSSGLIYALITLWPLSWMIHNPRIVPPAHSARQKDIFRYAAFAIWGLLLTFFTVLMVGYGYSWKSILETGIPAVLCFAMAWRERRKLLKTPLPAASDPFQAHDRTNR